MKNFFRSMGTFWRSMPHFLLFEMLYKLILLAVGAPLLAGLMKLTMNIAGINYLYDENLLVYLHHPATIFVVLILLFCAGFFTFVELSALAACFSCFEQREHISVGGMLHTGLRSFRKMFRGSGILRFVGFMLCMPLAEFTLSSGMFLAPVLPVLRRVFAGVSSGAAAAAYLLIQAIFIMLIVSRSYSFHYLVLTDKSFLECGRASRSKISGKKLRMAVYFLLWTMFILAVTMLATFGLSFVIVLFIKGFSNPDTAYRWALTVLRYAVNVFTAVSAFFSAPAIMCWLTGCFYADLGADEKTKLPDRQHPIMKPAHKTVLSITLAVAAILVNVSFFRGVYKGNIIINNGIFSRTQVSAHRGASSVAPENTKYAFKAAMNSGTDYIELDVQLTKDGKLVVFHDKTVDRTTDGTGDLSDYTYDELMELSAGSWFSRTGEFDDAKIMTLREVFDLVGKEKMLNIEIKEFGDSLRATEKTVELIQEYGLSNSCYVSSFSYPLLKLVKLREPKIKTALIANVAVSTSYSQLKYIDAVSLNYIFINQSVINSAHQNGKRVFVWTVDRREDMEQMEAMGVDNIITNYPDRAVEVVYSRSVGDTVLRILEAIFGR